MRRGTGRIAVAVTALALVAVLVAAGPALGAKKRKKGIHVRPGQDAISRALARADHGDVLRVHRGRYEETVGIDKRVKLVGVGKRRPVIDGECSTRSTVEAFADSVRFRRLKVVGGLAIEIDFNGVSEGRVNDVVVRDTCEAEYGVNIFDTGPIAIVDSRARGFSDAGFYIGEITATPGGRIRLADSEAYGNNRGVIVENSAGGDIRVRDNDLHDNDIPGYSGPVGIVVHNSDGVLIHGNESRANGMFGLHLTSDSDDNVITSNTLLGNPVDVRNDGTGNCGSGNAFATGDPLPPC